MAKLKVERLGEGEYRHWDEYVASHPFGTLFHTTGWLKGLAAGLEVSVVVDADGGIRGGAALIETRRFGQKGYHLPPFSPYFGPLAGPSRKQSRASADSEVQKILELLLARLPKSGHYDFKLSPGDGYDILPYIWRGFQSSVWYTHEIHPQDGDFIAGFAKTHRNYLNRLRKMVTDGELSLDAAPDFYECAALWRTTAAFKRFNLRVKVLKELLFGRGVHDGEFWKLSAVRDNTGRMISSSLMVYDKRRTYYLVNGTLRGLGGVLNNANLLCMDEMLQWTLGSGRVFDFEGSMLRGVEEYFRHLGGVKVPTIRLQKSHSPYYYLLRVGKGWLSERRS